MNANPCERATESAIASGSSWELASEQLKHTDHGRRFIQAWQAFMQEHGHHCRGELEFFNARWSERPHYILGLVRNYLKAIDETRFVPESGRTRLRGMIADRPDWCVSRQRLWGVPLPIFIEKATGEILRDQDVLDRVAEAFEEEGGDAWFASDPQRFLGNKYQAAADLHGELWFDRLKRESEIVWGKRRTELKGHW